MTESKQYIVRSANLNAVADALKSLGNLQSSDEETLHRTWYDSFDWRLYHQGLLMWADGRGRRASLTLAAREGGAEQASVPMTRAPKFVEDLPEGIARTGLAAVLEMRALMPVAELDTRRVHYRLLDDESKTVMRLVADYPSVKLGEDRQAALPIRITLQPIRGYTEWLDASKDILDKLDGLEPAASDMLTEALMIQGRRPGDYSSKLDIPLDPGMSAGDAVVRIHKHLLATLRANIEGTGADLDSEFLHDLRVAVRRTRSALTQVKGVFPADTTMKFKEGFSWVGQITGPTRDLDVYLLEYEKYQAMLPHSMREDLQPFREFLIKHQRTEQRKLRRALKADRFGGLIGDWEAFLESPLELDPEQAPNAGRPVTQVAGERIWRMYRRVRKEGRAITPESPAEDLHELRKSCKKLRYLIEFFSKLYPADMIKPLIKELKKLLDNLGEFQDLEVHAGQLHDFTVQMQLETEVPLETLLAMGGLVTGLLQSQEVVRDAFAKRFARFDVPENHAVFQHLFKPAPRTSEDAS